MSSEMRAMMTTAPTTFMEGILRREAAGREMPVSDRPMPGRNSAFLEAGGQLYPAGITPDRGGISHGAGVSVCSRHVPA